MKHTFFNKSSLFFLMVWLVPQTYGLVGDWINFTYLNQITDLKFFKNDLFVATTGGIRLVNPLRGGEVVFNNPYKGITDVEISGFTVTESDELWAVSKSGIIYKWDGTSEWDTFNRNFAAYSGTVNDRAILSAGPFIILGSTKGLSFFLTQELGNVPAGNFYETFNIFGSSRDLSVTSLHRQDSLLTIGTSKGVFQAAIYWPDPKNPPNSFANSHERFLNPQLWKQIETDTNASLTGDLPPGSLALVDGHLTAFGVGTVFSEPAYSQALSGSPLIINGKTASSDTHFVALEISGDKIYAGGSEGLFQYKNNKLTPLTNSTSLPKGEIFNVSSSWDGITIWNANLTGIVGPTALYELTGAQWNKLFDFPLAQNVEPKRWKLNNLHQRYKGEVYLGNWGWGIDKIRAGFGETESWTGDNSCLKGIPGSSDFVVVRGLAPFQNEGLFMTLFHVTGAYTMAYLKFDEDEDHEAFSLTCFEEETVSNEQAIYANDIKVIADQYLLVSTLLDVQVYKIEDRFAPDGLKKIRTLTTSAASGPNIRASNVDFFGRLWVASTGELYTASDFLPNLYYPDYQDSLVLLEDFEASECNHFKRDQQGNLWAGCEDGLLKITPGEDVPLKSHKKYTPQDGLLSPGVVHLDIQPGTGYVLAVTDKGLSLLEAGVSEFLPNLKSAAVFPNPFLQKHSHVVFAGLTPLSKVYILNQSGNIVYESVPGAIAGNQLLWNGKSARGERVGQGVYFYVIQSGKEVKKGKLIIAR